MSAARYTGHVPSAAHAADLAWEFLGDVGTRLAHVLRAGTIAESLTPLFDKREGELLVAAATLHDIGYSPRLAHTGFHPLDGGIYLAGRGFSRRLAGLVANHSLAYLHAPAHGVANLDRFFPRETGLLADALMAADMHSAPDGRWVRGEDRLSEIAGRHTYPETTTRLELLRQALARVAAAARAAGLPDLDLEFDGLCQCDPLAVTPPSATGRITPAWPAQPAINVAEQFAAGHQESHTRAGSAARLRVSASRRKSVSARLSGPIR